MRHLMKIIDWCERVCLYTSAVAAVAIMFLTVLDVALRKLTVYGIPGLYEMTQDYLMVILVFLSISHVYRQGKHVRVTLFLARIPAILRKPLQATINLMTVALLLVICHASYNAGMDAWKFKEVSSNILAYPLAPALFLVPLGCGLTALRALQAVFVPNP